MGYIGVGYYDFHKVNHYFGKYFDKLITNHKEYYNDEFFNTMDFTTKTIEKMVCDLDKKGAFWGFEKEVELKTTDENVKKEMRQDIKDVEFILASCKSEEGIKDGKKN